MKTKYNLIFPLFFFLRKRVIDESGEWYFLVELPALRRLRQKNLEFKVSLGYPATPCRKK
jgi:hypothetical protein